MEALTLSLLLKQPPRKLETWLVLWSWFFDPIGSFSRELSRLMKRFLHVESGGTIFNLTTTLLCLWHLNAVRPPQFYIAKVLRKSCLWTKMFLFFEDFCYRFLPEMYLNKSWYCSELDLIDRDLEFTTRFWIPIIELFVIMNSFTITEINKKQWI